MPDRKLSARSVIASTLLGVHPPMLPARVLVRSGELFGMSEGATRVALSRMAAAGEVEPAGDDDASYRLAGRLLERQIRQDESRRASTSRRRWTGHWHLGVVVAERRRAEDRVALRHALDQARFAELREGVWTRPDNLGSPPVVTGEVLWGDVTFAEGNGPGVDALWDVTGWARAARALRHRIDAAEPALQRLGVVALGDTFVLSAAVLRHFQADPLLPVGLLPRDWPGGTLRAAYDRFDATFRSVWAEWYRSIR
jgi:phenylacetic acid degradation operon negative regulatory protein